MRSEAPHFLDVPSYCGCTLPSGHRGSTGWHFRPTERIDSTSRNFEAYERCPPYWKRLGFQVDPLDRRLLRMKDETKPTRKVMA